MNRNILLATDAYKFGGHLQQYPKGTTKIYSYLIARSDKKLPQTVFFGLQYYLTEYLSKPVTHADVDEAVKYRKMVLGDCPADIEKAWRSLADLGYLPLEIKAVDEGVVMPVKNVLLTITNTHSDFFWLTNMVESLLLKVWYPTTVASNSKKFKDLCLKYSEKTCDDNNHVPFQVHSFGYRGVSSEESAELSGAAHLTQFLGSDDIVSIKFLNDYYDAEAPIGLSVPASEHSVMQSFGREGELDAFKNMLKLYPTGIVSIVSDTYNLWNVLTNFTSDLYEDIINRDGKVVFRPDSGDPELIICGTPDSDSVAVQKGALQLLWDKFGGTINSKGMKVLNPKVGLIYGDSMYYERFERVLAKMEAMGFASSNLVIGVGGLLLQQHNRDDQGYAIKATYAEINGQPEELMKDPITDPGKKSHKGLLCLMSVREADGTLRYWTQDQCDAIGEKCGVLKQVFLNGVVTNPTTLQQIRDRVNGI